MGIPDIAAYVLSLFLTVLTISLSQRLVVLSRHGTPYQNYLFLIIVNNLLCILDLIFRDFPTRFSAAPPFMNMLWGFIAFPLMAMFTYFFAAFFFGFFSKKPHWILKSVFWTYWGFMSMLFFAIQFRFFSSGEQWLLELRVSLFDIGITAILFFVVISALLRSATIRNRDERRILVGTAIFYLISIFFFFALNSPRSPIRIYSDILTRSLLGLVYNLPAILWMLLHLGKNRVISGPDPIVSKNVAVWLDGKNISAREREIIQFIVTGRSNRAIEDELFISRRTVETHVYNIYRKLGVKNRVQLTNLINSLNGPR